MAGVCCFDNPNNLTRECYEDGRLVYHVQVQALLQVTLCPPVLFFGADRGPFTPGRLNGSICALPVNLWPFVAL